MRNESEGCAGHTAGALWWRAPTGLITLFGRNTTATETLAGNVTIGCRKGAHADPRQRLTSRIINYTRLFRGTGGTRPRAHRPDPGLARRRASPARHAGVECGRRQSNVHIDVTEAMGSRLERII
ncbi:hypothetical protein EVAR_98120_1 [Eumeta japonica]|uniref:Uncharacterized protein n=1 Tax=Eumeta variegata TaxID=151549 RepID=A0A4C2AAF8_EUMVA|nr:hypothetical protein EVAR_98120_1 [Eumeta japonica]